MWLLFIAVLLLGPWLHWKWKERRRRYGYRTHPGEPPAKGRTTAKPPWVREAVIHLKALSPELGCRGVAITFNRLHAGRMSIGKTFVADTFRRHRFEILHTRRRIRRRQGQPGPINRAFRTRTSIAILRVLLDTIERYGKPKAIRTDNEALFTSRTFRLVLWQLGIR